MKQEIYIGVMSGTSMDGLDVAACRFEENGFEVIKADTFAFPANLKEKLKISPQLSAPDLAKLDADLGFFIGETVKRFLSENDFSVTPTAIASHGHTVIHDPENGFTLQIGSGAHMSQASGLPCIVDFRSNDVAAGGQGAPLVPIGDLHLFAEYPFCLNLGGIANISSKNGSGKITGFDICGCNLILNDLAKRKGISFDKDGAIAKNGNVNENLLAALLKKFEVPSDGFSLDAQKARHLFFSEAENYEISLEDLMATAVEFVAQSVAITIDNLSGGKNERLNCLITGGGAHNLFLIEKIKKAVSCEIVVPGEMLIDYKEALIFAYMGWLRWQGKPNCLASVTGAAKDTIGGAVYLP